MVIGILCLLTGREGMYVGAQHGQVCASGQTDPPSQVKRPGDILMLENQGFHLVLSKRSSNPFPQGGSPGSWVPLTTRGKEGKKNDIC